MTTESSLNQSSNLKAFVPLIPDILWIPSNKKAMSATSLIFTKSRSEQNWLGLPTLGAIGSSRTVQAFYSGFARVRQSPILIEYQRGKTFCTSFCASLIAGSSQAFLCVDCVRLFVCLSLREFWLRLNEMHKVWTFAPRKAFLLLCGFCFSSLENYFGLGTTNVKGKTDHSVSLRWNKEFWTFPKRRVFFLIVHSIYLWVDFAFFRRAELKPAYCFVSKYFSHAQIHSLCRTSFILLFSQRSTLCAVKLSRK